MKFLSTLLAFSLFLAQNAIAITLELNPKKVVCESSHSHLGYEMSISVNNGEFNEPVYLVRNVNSRSITYEETLAYKKKCNQVLKNTGNSIVFLNTHLHPENILWLTTGSPSKVDGLFKKMEEFNKRLKILEAN